ncbi:MAG: metallophosphoesterase [Magnetococcales bacterium]|nr:metallophosphoesterase [Magnetococcales bacterium]
MQRHWFSWLLSTLLLLLAGPALATTTVTSYVILGEKGHQLKGETVPLLRLILDKADEGKEDPCQALTLTGSGQRKLVTPLIRRTNPNPKSYPITVCEAVLPFADRYDAAGEAWQLAGSGKKGGAASQTVTLPTVVRQPEQLFIVGDSGCRDRAGVQTCEDGSWPFAQRIPHDIASQIRQQGTGAVIIHTGDVKYRGGKDDSDKAGLSWRNWQQEFFSPAAPLLAMAPWVIARGNHELCNSYGRNGPGWFYLFDPASSLLGDSKELLQQHRCQGQEETLTTPYRLDFGHRFSLVMIDSSSVQERNIDKKQAQQLTDWLTTLGHHLVDKQSPQQVWLITHKPIWAVAQQKKATVSNLTEQQAVQQLPHHALPESVRLVLSGHKHFFSMVEFEPSRKPRHPLALVVGNSGVGLNCDGYNGHHKELQASIRTMNAFGYVSAQLVTSKGEVSGWRLQVQGYDWQGNGQMAAHATPAASCSEPSSEARCSISKPALFPSAQCGRDEDDDE